MNAVSRLEILAIPAYWATMAVEYVHHRGRRARTGVELPGDYERRDSLTSLTMGAGSLVIPIVAPKILGQITPGKGRYGKVLVGAALGAAAATTVADVVARRCETSEEDGRWARSARRVSMVGSVATVALGGTAITTGWQHATRLDAMWRRRSGRDLGTGAAAWTVAVVGWDLLYYWNHRMWHECRFLWANHVMHHSSERYNLSTALRQTVTDPWIVQVPYSLLCLLGVRPAMVSTSRSINLLYQYWVHTDAIGRLGRYEAVGNTPSHHRVHHGSNKQYIDRNHAGILIVWDRLFGTFEPEDEAVVYGLTKNLNTFNPLRVAAHEYYEMLRDVARATTWRERLSYVLRGPGWAYERRRELEAA